MFIKIIEKKLGVNFAYKCGSRTIIAYAYLLKYPNSIHDTPEKFYSIGKYEHLIPFAKSISIPFLKYKSEKYPNTACVVRDPIERFVSAYSDKIRIYTGKEMVDVQEFIDMYDSIEPDHFMPKYSEEKILVYEHIKSHIIPLCEIYGEESSFYSHIFNLGNMDYLKKMIETLSNTTLPQLKLNECHLDKKISLNSSQKEWILKKYKKDIQIYGRWM